MAFFSRASNILKQAASRQVKAEFSATQPFIYQALRCMSSSKLFVGGLAWATDEVSLKDAFSKHGEVIEAKVIMDRDSGRSRGFGFVTYSSTDEASSAMQAWDGQELDGRSIRVNYAADRQQQPRFGGGGGYGGGGYGGGGGGYGGGGYGGGGGGYGGSGGGYGSSGGGYGGSGGGYGVSGGGGGYGDSGAGGGSYGGSSNYGGGGGGYGVAAGGNDSYGSGVDGGVASNDFGGSSSGFGEGGFGTDEPISGIPKDDNDIDGDYAKRA